MLRPVKISLKSLNNPDLGKVAGRVFGGAGGKLGGIAGGAGGIAGGAGTTTGVPDVGGNKLR